MNLFVYIRCKTNDAVQHRRTIKYNLKPPLSDSKLQSELNVN